MIEQLVQKSRQPERVLVVTSDRAERDTVEAAGAGTESCGHFLGRLADARRELDLTLGARRARCRGASLGEFFP
jgi:predicted RNA-binding protein with PIN domain